MVTVCPWLNLCFPDIILTVSKHLGIEILRQKNTWPIDRWHDQSTIQYIYGEMDVRRHSFVNRRQGCVYIALAACVASAIVGYSNALVGVALFAIVIFSIINYYQNNLSHYFSDPYEYELEVVENSLDNITETEATEFAEIILTRKDIEQRNKRIRASSRNNFLFLDIKKHHDQK